jgi:hypothetical protein
MTAGLNHRFQASASSDLVVPNCVSNPAFEGSYGHPPLVLFRVTSTGELIAVAPPAWVTTLWKT